jgi:hypothetical protein
MIIYDEDSSLSPELFEKLQGWGKRILHLGCPLHAENFFQRFAKEPVNGASQVQEGQQTGSPSSSRQ